MASKLRENIAIFFSFQSFSGQEKILVWWPTNGNPRADLYNKAGTDQYVVVFLIIMIITAVLSLVAYSQHQQSFSALT